MKTLLLIIQFALFHQDNPSGFNASFQGVMGTIATAASVNVNKQIPRSEEMFHKRNLYVHWYSVTVCVYIYTACKCRTQ